VRSGRSRSSKVVDFGTNRKGVCDFLLVINSKIGLILHLFWDTATCWKLRIFPTPLSYNALALGEPFRISGWTFYCQDQSPWAIRSWRFRDPSLRRFHSVPACDGQTDGRTDGETDIPTVANTGLCKNGKTERLNFSCLSNVLSYIFCYEFFLSSVEFEPLTPSLRTPLVIINCWDVLCLNSIIATWSATWSATRFWTKIWQTKSETRFWAQKSRKPQRKATDQVGDFFLL